MCGKHTYSQEDIDKVIEDRDAYRKVMLKQESELGAVAVLLSGKIEHKYGLDTIEGLSQSIEDLIAERDKLKRALRDMVKTVPPLSPGWSETQVLAMSPSIMIKHINDTLSK